ncbi:MAG: type II secretion system GspH family protein [Streptococcaceae bacterium]|jgi:competence protein ComGD|nr:type II secretion system GspH family protein [Streptococcaceae bacterium]
MKILKSNKAFTLIEILITKNNSFFNLKKLKKKSCSGFTLLETLLVLSITLFLVTMFSFTMTKSVHIVRGELFVAEFEEQYKNTQLRASAFRKELEFSASGNKLIAGGQVIKIPEEVKVDNFKIKFDKYGNNSSLAKLRLHLPCETKTISYQLEMGSGKYKKTFQ